MEHRIEAGQRRQVYDRASDNIWYVYITDEFLHGRGLALRNGIDINDNPNLNHFIKPLHPPQDFVIGGEYDERPEFQLHEFPPDEQVHYGFIVPGLERQHEQREQDPLDGRILRVHDDDVDNDDPWDFQLNQVNGGRTRRRKSKGKSKGKSKCKGKGKCKSKKTLKTRKCIRHRRAHK
jgi:hypothetical protein